MTIVIQLLSVLGALLILLGYVAVQRRWWLPETAAYLWANLVGAIFLLVVAIWDRRLGFILLEAVWAGVSLWSLVRSRPRNVA